MIYVYKQELLLNNRQGFISHEIQPTKQISVDSVNKKESNLIFFFIYFRFLSEGNILSKTQDCTNGAPSILISFFMQHFLNLKIVIHWNTRTRAQTHTIYIYVVYSISFQTFLFRHLKLSWKFSILLLHILWDDWPIFMILGSNQQLQQSLEYNLLKPDCHSWWISKMHSDTLEEGYAIKFCFKLGKNATETYRMLQAAFGASCMNRASVFE